MKSIEKLIIVWGILDLAAIAWYVCRKFFDGQIPFYSDFASANAISVSFGAPMPIQIASISIFFYISLLFSGYFLMKRHKFGAIISYIQCPFRLLSIIPISIFFLTWPIKHVFGIPPINKELSFIHPSIIAFISLVLLSEIIKTTTVIRWHVMINRSV